jgi:cell division protein ZapA
MATVSVVVNGRTYSVGCEDGQESHVAALAREFDRQVQEVGGQVGQVGDLRLFLMAALMGADELADMKLRLAQMQSQLAGRQIERAAPPPPPPSDRGEVEQKAAAAINAAAARIEALTAKLELDAPAA